MTAVGAYSEENRLEYIEYNWYDSSAELQSVVRNLSDLDFIPSSGLHFFAGTSEGNIINGGTADSASANGYSGDDQISGTLNSDWFYGGDGDDIIDGNGGNDVIFGGSGDDIINGGDGDDIINDTVSSNIDWFTGGEGNDTIDGGNGDDLLE